MDAEDDRSRNTSSDQLTKRDDDTLGRKRRQSTSTRHETPNVEPASRRRRSSSSMPNGTGSTSRRHSPLAHHQSSVPPTIDENSANASRSATSPQPEPMAVDSQHTSQGVTPYGTRSRNRTGGSRPNYAEDHDFDLEVESNGIPSKTNGLKKSPAALVERHPAESERPQGVNTRRGFAAVNGTSPNSNNSSTSKELIPGTSTFSANPTILQNGSKKRKQPGSQTTTDVQIQQAQQFAGKTRGSYRGHHDTSMMSFEMSQGILQNDQLIADDGTSLQVNDHVYLICEPPGEPYYLARIMQFLPTTGGPIDSVRVNWFYRPRDIQRRVQDSRVVFASMHSDTCPLTSLRGKCQISHVSDIDNMDEYRKIRDSFWFEKLYDRYMQRYYEVVPTRRVTNVPIKVKKALDDRWKFVLTEIGRTKELTRDVKSCKRCGNYAANHDSVDCAMCGNTYHMTCIRPILLKKPARGFAWSCAACSRAQEKRIEARHTPLVDEGQHEDEEIVEEEDGLNNQNEDTRDSSTVPEDIAHPQATPEQITQASLWPYRYFGMHCKAEDALDHDDRIYPRASSRLGPRHQANVSVWHGRPVELAKPSEIKKKYIKTTSHKKDAQLSKETKVALDADRESKLKRPKWVQDEPPGYIPRGEDDPIEIRGKKEKTAQLYFKMPDTTKISYGDATESELDIKARENLIDDYVCRIKSLAHVWDLPPFSTNLLTKGLEVLCENNYDADKAVARMEKLNIRTDLKEPDLSKEEVRKFEEGVTKYGSELYNITKYIGGIKHARVVRFYYMWKKTSRGQQIWGNYEGRKSRKDAKRTDELKAKDANASKLLDDVADDHDDSAFDNSKAAAKNRGFECKFCRTRSSRQWRRAPATAPGTMVPRDSTTKAAKDKTSHLNVALCHRCAILWRKYGIQWEPIEEVSKKIATGGGRAWKRKVDEELLRALLQAQEDTGETISSSTAAAAASTGVEVPPAIVQVQEPPKKKLRAEKEATVPVLEEAVEKKRIVPEKPAEPAPLKPEPPRVKVLPCAVCYSIESPGDELLNCRDCRMAVHKLCYGVSPTRNTKKWICDMCSNDRNPMVSTTYECTLCPVKYTYHELMEPPKVSHKKKTDREREKERKEREMVDEAVRLYRQQQEAAGRPANPREPLKRTAGNNWVHVYCALWTPEIKFPTPHLLETAEGIGLIPPERFEQVCKICRTAGLPCVPCHNSACNASFHVGCARQAGFTFGLDVTPVKSSRRDVVSTLKLGEETGFVTPAIWCPHHAIPTVYHTMVEWTDEDVPALQAFARTFKQADLSVTGTVRRAAQMQSPYHTSPSAQNATGSQANTHRRSTVTNAGNRVVSSEKASRSIHASPVDLTINHEELFAEPEEIVKEQALANKMCHHCKTTVSPKWWSLEGKGRRHDTRPSHAYANGVSHSDSGLRTLADHGSRSHPQEPEGVYGNGIVKAEPSSTAQAPSGIEGGIRFEGFRDIQFQCHKCHLNKRVTPVRKVPDLHAPPPPNTNGSVVSGNLAYQAPHVPHTHLTLHTHPPTASGWPPQQNHWRQENVPHVRGNSSSMPPIEGSGYAHGHYVNGPPPQRQQFGPSPASMLHNQGQTYSQQPSNARPYTHRPYGPAGPPPPTQHPMHFSHSPPRDVRPPPHTTPSPRPSYETSRSYGPAPPAQSGTEKGLTVDRAERPRATTPGDVDRPKSSSGRISAASASPSVKNLLS